MIWLLWIYLGGAVVAACGFGLRVGLQGGMHRDAELAMAMALLVVFWPVGVPFVLFGLLGVKVRELRERDLDQWGDDR